MSPHQSDWRRHRGSIYLHVLATSLLVTILGMGSLLAVRVQMRAARLHRDCAEARVCAASAVELGLLYVKQDPNWRSTRPNGVWLQDKPLGTGRLTLEGIDPGDGVLNDSQDEPLVLTGIGTKGIARHKTQVTLVPIIKPLAALNTCLNASSQIQIAAANRVAVVGAPISTNADLRNLGTIEGSAEAQTASQTGIITGTLTVPGASKPMPDAGVFADYTSKATSVPYAAIIEKVVLAPGCNPLGPTDPNGLYVIDTAGNNLTIRNCRIYGTLIIKAPGKSVTIDDAMFMQNYRSDFPVLLVEGNAHLHQKSVEGLLSEATCTTNFNPVGAPYEGTSDSDTEDQYPNEIRGLVHVKGTLCLEQTACIVGVVVCEGTVFCQGLNTIVHNPSLHACPPIGYTFVERMAISPGSWRQVVD